MSTASAPRRPTRVQRARLLQVWRSAGWPFQDPLELDLLAAGWIEQRSNAQDHITVHLTEAGLAVLSDERQRHARAQSLHDRLALSMAEHLAASGRLVWRELSLRAALQTPSAPPQAAETLPLFAPEGATVDRAADQTADPAAAPAPPQVRRIWRLARPDLYSVRRTSVEGYLQPTVHEIKASRADLLSDLRHAAKREAYAWLCEACFYAYPQGTADPEEIPEPFGIWEWRGDTAALPAAAGRWELVRPARSRAMRMPFALWMALAAATPWAPDAPPRQAHLPDPGSRPVA